MVQTYRACVRSIFDQKPIEPTVGSILPGLHSVHSTEPEFGSNLTKPVFSLTDSDVGQARPLPLTINPLQFHCGTWLSAFHASKIICFHDEIDTLPPSLLLTYIFTNLSFVSTL